MSANSSSNDVDGEVETVFKELQDYLNSDHDIREEIRNATRELEQTARELVTKLQSIHNIHDFKNSAEGSSQDTPLQTLGRFIRNILKTTVCSQYADIANKIPLGQYYRFSDHWRLVTQRLCFIGTLVIFLESEKLASRNEIAAMLGLAIKADTTTKTFHLDLEDYLHGLLQLGSELSRFVDGINVDIADKVWSNHRMPEIDFERRGF